jgi:hypothetical protein
LEPQTVALLRDLGLTAVELLSVCVSIVLWRALKECQKQKDELFRRLEGIVTSQLETQVAIAVELGIPLPKREGEDETNDHSGKKS